MSEPRPIRLTLLAKRLHLPVSVVCQAAYALGAHWGMDRVAASFTDGVMSVTPAAVVAIQQAFGLAHLSVTVRRAS